MRLKKLILPFIASALALTAQAAEVKVVMSSTSRTMTLVNKADNSTVETGTPTSYTYTFEAPAGTYVLTAYASDGTTVNGTIEINVTDEPSQEFKVLTCTAYATNKNSDGSAWTIENGDYTLDITVNSREGKTAVQTPGKSTTAGRYTFLALNGNSYLVDLIPAEKHVAEGFTTMTKAGTLTFGATISGAIPYGGDYVISTPANAELQLNFKKVHFADFQEIKPTKVETKGDTKEYTFYLAQGSIYNYRTWLEGGLTQAGYFTFAADEAKRPEISFTASDYAAFGPKQVVHDVKYNGGYETGDIFVNINERGHLPLSVGDTFKTHAMRTWELTDNQSNNYFFEPDFHYTILDLNGQPSSDVIEIAQNPGSAWADIKAVGKGTAIVLVTYDAIGLNYWSNASKSPYMGGEFWSAIWPENTAAYVVTVDETPSAVVPNMTINETYNKETQKVAGKFVDAEHDVFYYLDSQEGFTYTFTPEAVADVTIAYPAIGEQTVTYSGFSANGVTKNQDGSYSLLLKNGRQIVKLTDAAGNSTYQVLTAKPCHREITNASRPGSQIFQPGDQIKIQYSGLFHPANKIAGIYNMSAYITYNGIPNGSSLILGSGQYTFGSAPSAQAVTIDIPADLDITTQPEIAMTEGVIQVNGYGDPIGNHRTIDADAGRSPNFTAVAHKTYFGAIPDIIIPLTAYKSFPITIESNVADANISLIFDGKALESDPDDNRLFNGTYGSYLIEATADGYRPFRRTFTIEDSASGLQNFAIEMVKLADGVWDGKTLTEPQKVEDVYQISSAAELAWFANEVNAGNSADAELTADIDLGDFPWTPMGTAAKPFQSAFNGNDHTIQGLYINATTTYNALFGYVKGASANAPASICALAVDGSVSSNKNYTAGIIAYMHQFSTVENCVNLADITGTGYVGGVVGAIYSVNGTALRNCSNEGTIDGTAATCGGVVGYHVAKAVIENVINAGTINATAGGACVGGTTSKENVKNAFSVTQTGITDGNTAVTDAQMASGEVAWLLGDQFGQTIGEDPYPVLGGMKVYRVAYNVIEPDDNNDDLIETLADAEIPAIYTNGTLPDKINDMDATWFENEEMTIPASVVDADKTLFVKLATPSGITNISDLNTSETRWFNLRGIEVAAPAPGVHGVFIRVKNGRVAKIML